MKNADLKMYLFEFDKALSNCRKRPGGATLLSSFAFQVEAQMPSTDAAWQLAFQVWRNWGRSGPMRTYEVLHQICHDFISATDRFLLAPMTMAVIDLATLTLLLVLTPECARSGGTRASVTRF